MTLIRIQHYLGSLGSAPHFRWNMVPVFSWKIGCFKHQPGPVCIGSRPKSNSELWIHSAINGRCDFFHGHSAEAMTAAEPTVCTKREHKKRRGRSETLETWVCLKMGDLPSKLILLKCWLSINHPKIGGISEFWDMSTGCLAVTNCLNLFDEFRSLRFPHHHDCICNMRLRTHRNSVISETSRPQRLKETKTSTNCTELNAQGLSKDSKQQCFMAPFRSIWPWPSLTSWPAWETRQVLPFALTPGLRKQAIAAMALKRDG